MPPALDAAGGVAPPPSTGRPHAAPIALCWLLGLGAAAGCAGEIAPAAARSATPDPAPRQLSAVAATCRAAGGAPDQISRCPAWGALAFSARAVIGATSPETPRRWIEAAAVLVFDADPWRRAAGRRFLELALVGWGPRPERAALAQQAVSSLRGRLETPAPGEAERLDLMRLLGNHGRAEALQRVRALRDDPRPKVRAGAWRALGQCVWRGVCRGPQQVNPAAVLRAHEREGDLKVRASLVRVAGALGRPEVIGWCDAALSAPVAGATLGAACRQTLSRLGTQRAFDRLLRRAERLAIAPAAPAADRALVDALGDCLPGLDRFSAERYLALVDRVLGQAGTRTPAAIARLAGQLGRLPEALAATALPLVIKHYRALLGWERGSPARQRALAKLRRAVMALHGGPQIDEDGHGHSLGSHNHDHQH